MRNLLLSSILFTAAAACASTAQTPASATKPEPPATSAQSSKTALPTAARPEPVSSPARTSVEQAPKSLPSRVELPRAVRDTLKARMEHHGERMSVLLASVVLLGYNITNELSTELAEEPKIGRPARGEKGTISALLPPEFFTYQDQLAVRAQALAKAAKEKNDAKLAQTFGALTETCVSCHSVYLSYDIDAMMVEDDE